MVLLWPLASSATANSVLAAAVAQQRRQRQIGDPNPVAVGAELDHLAAGDGHAVLAEEHHRRQHQDGRVDEEGDGQRHGRIDGVEADGAADGRFVLLQLAALHQGRVQVQVVRHHGRADDADGDVQHPGLAKVRRDQRAAHFQEAGLGLRQDEDLDEVADADGRDSSRTTASMVRIPKRCRASSSSTSKPVMMTAQNSGMWNSRLRATALPSTSARSQAPMATSLISQFGQRVHFGYQSRQHWARSLPVTTPSRAEITCMKMAIRLASADHPQQAVLELRAALQVGAPVAGVHVADADQDRRPDEGPPLLPEAGLMVRHRDGAVHPLQRHVVAEATPVSFA